MVPVREVSECAAIVSNQNYRSGTLIWLQACYSKVVEGLGTI